jgi:hypothetical protein
MKKAILASAIAASFLGAFGFNSFYLADLPSQHSVEGTQVADLPSQHSVDGTYLADLPSQHSTDPSIYLADLPS